MGYSIELFTADDFPNFGRYTEDVVTELNTILQDESQKENATGIHPLHHLRKDMLANPDVYLSEEMLAKLFIEKSDISDTQRTNK